MSVSTRALVESISMRHRVSILFIQAASVLVLAIPANSQEHKEISNPPSTAKAAAVTIRLGTSAVVIPAPEGYEEATSQFESIKTRFTQSEAPSNEMLLVHLMSSDCELLRRTQEPKLDQYTKVSIRQTAKDREYYQADLAALVVEFRKNGASFMDPNSPTMKSLLERVEQRLKKTNPDGSLDMSQPINMGELEVSPNNYSVMLLLPFKGSSGESMPILAGMSFMRLQQRLVYVYTYRRYHSKADVEILQTFTKAWTSSILAAN